MDTGFSLQGVMETVLHLYLHFMLTGTSVVQPRIRSIARKIQASRRIYPREGDTNVPI
jgi:hypothetical protein